MALVKPIILNPDGSTSTITTGDTIPIANLATGTPDGTKFIRDDGTLVTPPGLSHYIGTTLIPVNRASLAQSLTGITGLSSASTMLLTSTDLLTLNANFDIKQEDIDGVAQLTSNLGVPGVVRQINMFATFGIKTAEFSATADASSSGMIFSSDNNLFIGNNNFAGGNVIVDGLAGVGNRLVITDATGLLLAGITDNSTNWNTAFSQTRQWDGGSTGLVAATGRTSLLPSKTGNSLKVLRVNAAETDYELATPAGGATIIETEIDFGSTPLKSKRFIITDAAATTLSKIIINPSGNPAAGRGSDDWLWDTIQFAAKGNTGTFTLYATSNTRIKGKRKIFYTIN